MGASEKNLVLCVNGKVINELLGYYEEEFLWWFPFSGG